MSSRRLPRFTRSDQIAPLRLTERDCEILRLIHCYRFLRSSQVIAVLGGSDQPILRRLQLLYHHGYLDRPRIQLEYFHSGGSRPIVYGIGFKGWKLLKNKSGDRPHRRSCSEKNARVGRIFLEHALLVSDFMVAVELACRRQSDVRFISQAELEALSQKPRAFRWQVRLENNVRVTVEPDQTFALEFKNERGELDRILFFLEADRGTMPVKRSRLTQSSVYRKLIGYEATWARSIHKKRFGFNRFRVLTVTSIPGRVASLINACSQLKQGKGLFLFAHKSILGKPEELLSAPWLTTRTGETESILN